MTTYPKMGMDIVWLTDHIYVEDQHSWQYVLLYIWWYTEGVIFYEVQKSGETVNANCYSDQLKKVNTCYAEYGHTLNIVNKKIILLQHKAQPRVLKNVPLERGWDVLSRSVDSLNLGQTYDHFFESLQCTPHWLILPILMRTCIDAFIASKSTFFFKDGIHK